MKQKRIYIDKGFTFIELVVAMAITLAVIGFIGLTYSSTVKRYIHNREAFHAQMKSGLAIDYIAQELRNAGFIINWDNNPDAPPIAIDYPIEGANPDPGTDTITIRYAQGPVTGSGANVAVLSGPHMAGPGTNVLTVQPLTFSIPAGTLIVIYSPPGTANVRRVATTSNVNDTTITLVNDYSNDFNNGDIVAIVQETSFWIENGNLMMKNNGSIQLLAQNVEDLQVVLMNKDNSLIGDTSSATFGTMTIDQILNVRAVRLSLTLRGNKPIIDLKPSIPPSLEDHDRSNEPADQFLRRVQRTTVYLRNLGVLDS